MNNVCIRDTPDGMVALDIHAAHTVVMLEQPRPCYRCRVMHHWFINRHGETCCLDCDSKKGTGDVC